MKQCLCAFACNFSSSSAVGGSLFQVILAANLTDSVFFPPLLVLFAVATRNLSRPGGARQRAAVTALASGVAVAVSVGSLMRLA